VSRWERANSEIRGIARRLEQQYPDTNQGVGAFVAPMREHFVGETRTILAILSAAVGFVLLIACVNIANLLLARAGSRKREIAIRTAIGAGRRQLVRQLLTESLLLSLAGGLCGLALAFWSLRFLFELVPKGISGLTALHVDARVLGFTLAISILTRVAFGLLPAFRTMRVDLNQVLKQGGGHQSAGRGSRWLERSLVIAEVAPAKPQGSRLGAAGTLCSRARRPKRALAPGSDSARTSRAPVSTPRACFAPRTRKW